MDKKLGDVGPVIPMAQWKAMGMIQKICATLSRATRALTPSIRTSSVSFKELVVRVEQYCNELESEMDREAWVGVKWCETKVEHSSLKVSNAEHFSLMVPTAGQRVVVMRGYYEQGVRGW